MYLYGNIIKDVLFKESHYNYIKTARDIEY